MDILVTDASLKRKLLRRRRAWGGDHHDEVWNGVYVMSPWADDEHQKLALQLAIVLSEIADDAGNADVRAGVTVSDRDVNWSKNFRVPDVVLRYHDGVSQIRGKYWLGGPDFLIESRAEAIARGRSGRSTPRSAYAR